MRHYDLITLGLEVLRVTHNIRWGAVYLQMIFGVGWNALHRLLYPWVSSNHCRHLDMLTKQSTLTELAKSFITIEVPRDVSVRCSRPSIKIVVFLLLTFI